MASISNLFARLFIGLNIGVYRLTGGMLWGRFSGLPLLILTTTGRKSGARRSTPLGFIEYDGGYVITASNSGSDRHPGWYYNLRANPQASVQIKRKVFSARAEEAPPALRTELWERVVSTAPGYGKYARSANRTIPLMILHPEA